MLDVAVIADPLAAEVSLDPMRSRLLAALAEPASAASLAGEAGLSRQQANYHLRALERHGLVELVEERRKGNLTERILRATAASYVISPAHSRRWRPIPTGRPIGVRALDAGAGRAARPRGRRPDHAVERRPEADRHLRDRHGDPLRRRGRPRGLRTRARRRRLGPGRQVPRPAGRGRPRAPLVAALHPSITDPPTRSTSPWASSSRIRREVELPATPEEVGQAVATGPGTASWLFPEEPGPNDLVESDRPHRYAVRTEGEGGYFNAVEFVIEAREGGTAVLSLRAQRRLRGRGLGRPVRRRRRPHRVLPAHARAVPRALQPADGDLRRRRTGGLIGPEASMTPDAFGKLKRELGASSEGDRVSLPNGGGDGVVDYATDTFLGVRTGDALYRFFGRNAFGGPVGMSIHHFGDVDVDAASRDWSEWLNGVYA